MNARSHGRHLLTPIAAVAFLVTGCFVYHSSAAPLPASLLSGKSLALAAPTTPVAPAVPTHTVPASHSVLARGGDNYRNSFPSLVPALGGHTPGATLAAYTPIRPSLQIGRAQAGTTPLSLVPFSSTEVVDITDSNGNVVRAPGSLTNAAGAASEPAPNQVLHFKVQLSGTNASAVYIQFKDPDSQYQDINNTNGGSPLEHKVFSEDAQDYHNSGTDDGSATEFLFNGRNGQPTQTFTGNKIGTRQQVDRGTIGDDDATSYLTVGTVFPSDQAANNNGDGSGIEVTDGTDVHFLPGLYTVPSVNDPANTQFVENIFDFESGAPAVEAVFHPLGQEYECQYLNANDNGSSTSGNPSGYPNGADADATKYGTPYYLAGYDDQFPFGPNGTGIHNEFHSNGDGTFRDAYTARPEWLQLTPVAGNPSQYEAYWAPPASPSDFYMDVIVVDNATPAPNWRIFDNIWGFSTLPFGTAHDILLVNDNALGQKFNASTPGATPGNPVNLRPVFYGAESYFTDINENLLPNSVETWLQPVNRKPMFNGTTAFATDQTPVELVQGLGFNFNYTFAPSLATTTGLGDMYVYNGLGYFSYEDIIAQRQTVPAVPSAADVTMSAAGSSPVVESKSQAYSLWRVLSRGRVPTRIYQAYEPTFVTQPAVKDPVSGFTSPVADGATGDAPQVINATRCILWVAPFAGDEPLNVSGSITDANVQTDLTNYVNAGGRLMVNGQEVASALTLNGQANTGPGFFLYNVLNATLNTLGNQQTFAHQTLNGVSGVGNQISFDSLINESDPFAFDGISSNFLQFIPTSFSPDGGGTDTILYKTPADYDPIYVGNNYIEVQGQQGQWRTDGSATQLGPATQEIGSATIQGLINTINPVNGAKANFSNGEGSTLVYNSNYTSKEGSGFGSRVVFSSFGLEGLGSAFYRENNGNQDFFFPRNARRDVLHNVVSYLRTGTFKGSITEELSSGATGGGTTAGVAGATVYLLPFRGVDNQLAPGNISLPGGRQCYSGTTSDGTQMYTDGSGAIPVGGYEIDGVEPGMYQVYVYKNGFTRTSSPVNNVDSQQFAVYGDTTATVNLSVTPLPPGTVSGTVTFSSGAAASGAAPPAGNGATVTFTSADGSTVITTPVASDGTGNYSVDLPPGTYSAVATSTSPGATASASNIVISANNNTTQNFVLQLLPATISGQVVETVNGVTSGVNGATVTFTPVAPTTGTVQSTTTATVNGVAGSFTSPSLSGGTYTVTASDIGLVQTGITPANPITVNTGGTVTGVTITLSTAPPAVLTGTVKSASGALLSGATITVTTLTGTPVVTSPTTVTTGPDGSYSLTVAEGSYDITASLYSYQSETLPVTITATTATQDFILQPGTALRSFASGKYNLVSWPYNAQFTDVFGPVGSLTGDRTVAYYYQNGGYVNELQNLFPVDEAHPGYGYFIYFYGTRSVYTGGVTGTPPAGSTVDVPLNPGWNMIGTPSTSAISVSRLAVAVNGNLATPFTFDQAASGANVYVSPVLYSYDPNSNQYKAVVSATGAYGLNQNYNGQTQLQPFLGYWLYAYQSGDTLVIPTSGG